MSDRPAPLPWIRTLPPASQARVLALGSFEEHGPGAALISKGQSETHLFLVEAGEVHVHVDGGPPVALGEGEVVGEMAFLDNEVRRNAVTVARPSRLRRIERLELMTAFAADPKELQGLLQSIAALREARLSAEPTLGDGAAEFVSRLAAESLRHRAVHHPYLQALADGSYPSTRWALADFARQYYGYSSHFPRYLTTVISRLEQPAHRRALLENLTEESGIYGDEELEELAKFGVEREWIEGIAHPLLFQRFSEAIGVRRAAGDESDQIACWRELFLQLLANGTPAEALGALGLGTENIVRTIYGPFVQAIGRLGDLSPRDTVFFPLHTAVDDHHQATLQAISADFARSPEGRAGLRRGMLKALQLRSAFWDWLHARALDPDRADEVV
jgi:pyrroloquinoline quinone (PQQ) biosynthesis protein C